MKRIASIKSNRARKATIVIFFVPIILLELLVYEIKILSYFFKCLPRAIAYAWIGEKEFTKRLASVLTSMFGGGAVAADNLDKFSDSECFKA